MPQGFSHVARRAVGPQEAGGGEDRVPWVVDVATGTVQRPGRREELHGSERTGRARAANVSDARLDQMDCRQVGPRHASALLRFPVVADQLRRWERRDDAPARQRLLWGSPTAAVDEAVGADGADAIETQQPRHRAFSQWGALGWLTAVAVGMYYLGYLIMTPVSWQRSSCGPEFPSR